MIIRRGRQYNSPKEAEKAKEKEVKQEVDIEELSWNELRTYIAENDIDTGGNTKKADIIAYIKKEV